MNSWSRAIYNQMRQGSVKLADEETRKLVEAYDRALREVQSDLLSVLNRGVVDQDELLSVATRLDIARQVYDRLTSIYDSAGISYSTLEKHFNELNLSVGAFLKNAGYTEPDIRLTNVMFSAVEKGMPVAYQQINTALGKYSMAVQQEVMNGIILGKGIPQIVEDALKVVGAPENPRTFGPEHVRLSIQRSVRWNVMRSVNFGAVEYYKELNSRYNLGIKGQWVAQVSTACPSCLQLHGSVVPMGDAFSMPSDFKGEYYGTSMVAPPLHVNCKCIVVPYFDDVDYGKFSTENMKNEAQRRLDSLKGEK